MVTSKALTALGVPHFVVVEPQQAEEYRAAVQSMRLNAEVIEMDLTEKDRYELCDNLGLTRSTGPGPARNFAWRHAIESGAAWHWVMDDNIKAFYRYSRNLKVPVADGAIFLAEKMETQKLPGGNTDEFYLVEGQKKDGAKYADTGTVAKSVMLAQVHPDVSRVAIRFKRVHHHVDYRPFVRQALIRKPGLEIPPGPNEYGMQLVKLGDSPGQEPI